MSEIILRTLPTIVISIAVSCPVTVFIWKKLIARYQKKTDAVIEYELEKIIARYEKEIEELKKHNPQ